MLWAAVVAALALAAAAGKPEPTPDANGRIPFDVYFDTTSPLGLRLDTNLIVQGFSKAADGMVSPAEAAKWIVPGDTLVAVNGHDVLAVGLQRAVLAIRDAELPKVLTFLPRKAGENRAADMQRVEVEETADTSTTTGVFEVAVIGTNEETEASLFPVGLATLSRGSHGARVLVFRIPVLMAHFGSLTSCTKTKVVAAQPSNACGSFSNEARLSNAIVVVDRGACSFADKAANVQVADGAAMVLLNDDGPAIRMTKATDDNTNVFIPSLCTSAADGTVLRGVLSAAASSGVKDVVGRIVMYNQVCSEHFFPASVSPKADDPTAEIVPQVLLHDGTTLDEEAAGSVAVGTLLRHATLEASGETQILLSLKELFRFEFVSADFGGSFSSILHEPHPLVFASPLDGCTSLTNTPHEVYGAVVVVERGGCTFDDKHTIAKAAGAVGVVLLNNELNLFAMPTSGRHPIRIVTDTATLEPTHEAFQPATVMAPRAAGIDFRNLANKGGDLWIGNVQLDPNVRKLWDEVDTLQDHLAWPVDAKERRREYFKRSMHHHPDKPTGNKARFEALNYAFRRANHRFDPENFEFVDDME